ncbi:hypothetical protein F7725_012610 [Dissostichus mawsoni]|uniref:Uncharacterized protein n=1 Tax=Dissostichus mawsoni TaxID=36200 RepID=A0A7J5YRB6_DISMA|nr:hypothetical protein F7725_012610 [Dissostichus mawsoni]
MKTTTLNTFLTWYNLKTAAEVSSKEVRALNRRRDAEANSRTYEEIPLWQVQTVQTALVLGLCCTSSLGLGCSFCLGSSWRFSTSSTSRTFLTSWRGDDRTSRPLSPTRALEGWRRLLGEAML